MDDPMMAKELIHVYFEETDCDFLNGTPILPVKIATTSKYIASKYI